MKCIVGCIILVSILTFLGGQTILDTRDGNNVVSSTPSSLEDIASRSKGERRSLMDNEDPLIRQLDGQRLSLQSATRSRKRRKLVGQHNDSQPVGPRLVFQEARRRAGEGHFLHSAEGGTTWPRAEGGSFSVREEASSQIGLKPQKVLELLDRAKWMSVQTPQDPWICSEKEGASEAHITSSAASSIQSDFPGQLKSGFRDSTVDYTDCSLFLDALEVSSPFDSPAVVRAAVKDKSPREPPPKIAFLFLTRGHMPLQPVWQRFFHEKEGRYSVYVHASPQFRYSAGEEPFFQREIRSKPVHWGTMSVVDAFRRLIANALLDPLNARFVLVSESDIPIRSFDYVYKYLLKARESFIGGPHKTIRETGPGIITYGRPTMLMWRHGEAWSDFTRSHARILVEDWEYYEKGVAYCRMANSSLCVLDENLLQTILFIKDRSHVANRTVMSVDWPRVGAHPRLYQAEDITAEFFLGLQLETVDYKHRNLKSPPGECWRNGKPAPCWLFARKFAPSTVEKILGLPKSVLGY